MTPSLRLARAFGMISNPMSVLLVVTAAGLALRTGGIGLDLWIDEIATLEYLKSNSIWTLLTSYASANNHVLNSILVSASIATFGEQEWPVRLPAMLFGVAAIPVMYWVARLSGLSTRASIGAALILAVSYHHIWFSQNARGYTAYIFFSLLGTGALVRLLESPRRVWQATFVGASAINFLALLPSVCVFGAQVLVAVAYLWLKARRDDAAKKRAPRIIMALAIAAGIGAIIFSPIHVEMLTVLTRDAPAQVTAFRFWSIVFWKEIFLGFLPSLTPVWLAALAVAVAGSAWGFMVLLRQAPVVTGVLIGAHVLFIALTTVLGWPVYPRLFALGLPLAILIVVAAADAIDTKAARKLPRIAVPLVVALLVASSLLMVARSYGLPKQQYRAALGELGRRSGGDSIVVAVGVADRGISYYRGRVNDAPAKIEYARTAEVFNGVRKKYSGHPIYLVTTFNSALAAEEPELFDIVQSGWRPVVTLPATVRGGELTIWVPSEK